ANLLDVQEHLVRGQRLYVLLQGLDAGTALADDDSRARRVDVDFHLVGGPLDLDRGHTRVPQLLFNEALEAQVLMQPARVVVLGIPLRGPPSDHAEPEADWMRLLSHSDDSFSLPLSHGVRGSG